MGDEFHWLYERDLKPLTRKELEEECGKRGIKTNVKRKATLINRILQWQEDQDPPGETGNVDSDGYEIDEVAEEEARRAFEELDKRANARLEREEMEEEDDFGEVEEVFPDEDSAYDKDDDAANEAYLKKYGNKPAKRSSPLGAIIGAAVVAGCGYAVWHYYNYVTPEHAAQMY